MRASAGKGKESTQNERRAGSAGKMPLAMTFASSNRPVRPRSARGDGVFKAWQTAANWALHGIARSVLRPLSAGISVGHSSFSPGFGVLCVPWRWLGISRGALAAQPLLFVLLWGYHDQNETKHGGDCRLRQFCCFVASAYRFDFPRGA
jgi:hypothetical protein